MDELGASHTDINVTIQVPQYYMQDSDFGYPSPLHNIHIEPLLSSTEATRCLELAVAYEQGTKSWRTPDQERHTNYATCDFPVPDAPDLHAYLMDDLDFQTRIFTRLSQAYHVDLDDLLGFIDLFCVNYVAKGDESSDSLESPVASVNDQTMDRLDAHRDGSILSFTVLLTPPDQFQGGGTFFEALRRDTAASSSSSALLAHGVVRPPAAGYAVLHCGKLLHGADVVTQGQRTVLVGFVDVADWTIREGVERRACTSFGRLDVAERRARLQQERLTSGYSWSAKRSAKFLPTSSCFNKVIPAFNTAINRADPEFQRRVRLETEDMLLREILLDEKPGYLQEILSSGDISVL